MKRRTTLQAPPNVTSAAEVRVYRLANNLPLSLKAEVTGPLADQPAYLEFLEDLHEAFRIAAVKEYRQVSEVGEQRIRQAKYFFAAPFAEEGSLPPDSNTTT